jgi:hypothetical protein
MKEASASMKEASSSAKLHLESLSYFLLLTMPEPNDILN